MKNLLSLLVLSILFLTSCKKDKIEPNLKQVYSVSVSQINEEAPIVNELENTLGDIVWTYESTGVYHGRLVGGFPMSKTHVICNNGTVGFISSDIRHFDPDFIELRTFAGIDDNGNPRPSNGVGSVYFEVKVY